MRESGTYNRPCKRDIIYKLGQLLRAVEKGNAARARYILISIENKLYSCNKYIISSYQTNNINDKYNVNIRDQFLFLQKEKYIISKLGISHNTISSYLKPLSSIKTSLLTMIDSFDLVELLNMIIDDLEKTIIDTKSMPRKKKTKIRKINRSKSASILFGIIVIASNIIEYVIPNNFSNNIYSLNIHNAIESVLYGINMIYNYKS